MVTLLGARELPLGDVPVTLEAKRRCVERELALRVRTYAKVVGKGRMRQEVADWELRVLQAILEDYERKEP